MAHVYCTHCINIESVLYCCMEECCNAEENYCNSCPCNGCNCFDLEDSRDDRPNYKEKL